MRNWFLTRILQRKALKKIVNAHKGRYIPLSSARRVGFIADTACSGIAEALSELKKELNGKGIDYTGICLDTCKEPVTEKSIVSDPEISVIRSKDTNWYGIPKPEAIEKFLEPMDILIDLTSGKRLFQTDYILKRANASLTIGIDPDLTAKYDMIISPSSMDASASELVKNILKYLTTIH